MERRDRVIIAKLIDEITVAENMIRGCSLEDFCGDEMRKRAVCMTVINIGELVKGLSDELRLTHAEIPWRAIAGFRDVAAHKYQTLRMDDVYETVSSDLPPLKARLRALLD